MNKTAFITSVDNAAGHKLVNGLLEDSWRVFLSVPDTQIQAWDAFRSKYPDELTIYPIDVRLEESIDAVRVQVMKETNSIDLFIHNMDYQPEDASRTITDGLMYEEMRKAYDINTVGTLRVLSAFYDALRKGKMKRICVVTSVDGCNNYSMESDNYAHSMSKAALHMQLHILFNRLRPDGFTFRLYGIDGNEDTYGDYIVDYFLRGRSFENGDDEKHYDENRLVIRNGAGREYPW